VQNLLETMRIKQLCRAANVAKIDAGPKGAVIAFHNNHFARPDRLLAYIQKNSPRIKLRPDQKLSVLCVWEAARDRLKGVEKLLAGLAGLLGG